MGDDIDALLEELFEERGDGGRTQRLATCGGAPDIPGLRLFECLLTPSQQVRSAPRACAASLPLHGRTHH
jgi:hypothetical protein